MSSFISRIKPVTVPPTGRHTATVIFLHGSGDKGANLSHWIKEESGGRFTFPHIRLLFPTAPYRPYTAAGGLPSHVWFDRHHISPLAPEDTPGIQTSCDNVRQMVEEEMEAGIPAHRIIVGGFSMGGSLALYYGLRCDEKLAGVFALSSFLPNNSVVYEDLCEACPRPPVFQAHGWCDPLVRYDWGLATHQRLKALHINTEFHTFPQLYHNLNTDLLTLLHGWLHDHLPQHKH